MTLTGPTPELLGVPEESAQVGEVLQAVELDYGMVLTIEGEADQSLLVVQRGEVALCCCSSPSAW